LRAFLFYLELAAPGYLGFGVYLIINLLSSDSLRDFLFYMELASSGYFGFGVFLVYQLAIFFARLMRAFLFYVVRASPSYLGFGVYILIDLLSFARLRAFHFYVKLASLGYLGFGVYLGSISTHLGPEKSIDEQVFLVVTRWILTRLGANYLENVNLWHEALKLKNFVTTRRVHPPRETDFCGHWRVDFWYLKMKLSAHIFVQWTVCHEIWAISSQISFISSKNNVSYIDCHITSI